MINNTSVRVSGQERMEVKTFLRMLNRNVGIIRNSILVQYSIDLGKHLWKNLKKLLELKQ